MGTAAELRAMAQRLDELFVVKELSPPYPCRREPPGTFRVYAVVDIPEPITVSATPHRKREGLPALPPGDLGHSELDTP